MYNEKSWPSVRRKSLPMYECVLGKKYTNENLVQVAVVLFVRNLYIRQIYACNQNILQGIPRIILVAINS